MIMTTTLPAPLERLGAVVRRLRKQAGLSRPQLGERSGLSVRFLAKVEGGTGNISYLRLLQLARALDTNLASLVREAEQATPRAVALLGLRGAGKSTVGPLLGRRLNLPFVELDRLVEEETGMELGQIFELQGESYFRRVERDLLQRFLRRGEPAVLATSGGVVNDGDAFDALRRNALTVWLRATPTEHWSRVVSQGDRRPMEGHQNAMAELEQLWRTREPLYSRCAVTVDTSGRSPAQVAEAVASELPAPTAP